MRVISAPNALKGSVDAVTAARAIAEGVRRAEPRAVVLELPIADGGDGTRAVLCAAAHGSTFELDVHDALGRSVRGAWSRLDETTAVVDVATASGIANLSPSERDVLRATSFGTGELVRAALDAGCRRVIIGVGGSATVDGGVGLLRALGFEFLSERGAPIAPGGSGLREVARIDVSAVHPALAQTEIVVACDVDSPLLGSEGAARVYGPQKGATPEDVALLEGGLSQLAGVLERSFNVNVRQLSGGGAAGGIAAGLHGATGAKLQPGIELVLDLLRFDEQVRGVDWVITAEGCFDAQSLRNKGPYGVAVRARQSAVPTTLLTGGIAANLPSAAFDRFAGVFPIGRRPSTLERALAAGAEALAAGAEQVTRLFVAARLR